MKIRTSSQIFSEIWTVKGVNTFSEKDTIVIVNQKTGKVEEYEKVSSKINEGFIIQDDGSQSITPEEFYGMNGYNRARWIEGVMSDQTDEFNEEAK